MRVSGQPFRGHAAETARPDDPYFFHTGVSFSFNSRISSCFCTIRRPTFIVNQSGKIDRRTASATRRFAKPGFSFTFKTYLLYIKLRVESQ
ncbi:conserved hypothetical protein [delta proteobacterium NaphS2]|nr:conserved hypothetical protein [delta proteobacterium NaphS2]